MNNNRPICIIFFLVWSFICRISAVPAYPFKITVKTENGDEVSIFLRGDENRKYAVTIDGYSVLNDETGWWYMQKTAEGQVVKSSYKLMSSANETVSLKKFKETCPKGLVPDFSPSLADKVSVTRRTNSKLPVVGERRALVILMQYRDVPFKTNREDFISLFNSIDYHNDDATGSVRDFYRFASQGQLDYLSDIYGPYTSVNSMSYYGSNVSTGGNDAHAMELCVEAMRNLPDTIDLSRYDNDKDGVIDNVHIIYAGYGEEAGGSANAIWAHEYPHRINLKNEIGYNLAGYSCSPELRGNFGSNISHIGVVCHELGHALGAMDYYDTNYGTGGEYDGTGKWDIMASGSWNDDGRTPPNFNPYVRSTIFGWNKQVILEPNKRITMPRMEIDNKEQIFVYKMETGSDGDYFLLENRQKNSFDSYLPGEGLVIYHVHPNIDRYRTTNTINASHPQGLYPVCASGSFPDTKKYGEINSSGCPFPGTRNVVLFSAVSSPAALAWDGNASKVSLADIVCSNAAISFRTVESGDNLPPDDPGQPNEKLLIYKESFEDNVDKDMECLSYMGKVVWRTYQHGDIVTNSEYIPSPLDGDGIVMLFSGKESTISESELISKVISVAEGNNYIFAFDLCTKIIPGSINPSFSLYIEDDYGEYKIFDLSESVDSWKHIEIPLFLSNNKFQYKLHGQICSGGIFVDNICLYQEGNPSANSINEIENRSKIGVYNLSGAYLGDYNKLKQSLAPGVYLIRKYKTIHKIIVR